jgi:hypothetical protein
MEIQEMRQDAETQRIIAKKAAEDSGFAIAAAIVELAEAQLETARAISKLGLGDAQTHKAEIYERPNETENEIRAKGNEQEPTASRRPRN